MAITINGVVCQEIVADYEESAEWSSGPSGTKSFLCSWADRYTVANGLLGLSTTVSVGGVITLNLPMQHPQIPTIFVQGITIKPAGPFFQGTGPQFAFPQAVITAHYARVPWNFSGIDYQQINPATPFIYAKQNIRFENQTITVQGKDAWWKTAESGKNVTTGQSYGFPICVVQLEITLIHIPYLPAQAIFTAANAPLNSVEWLNCAPGTLFFRGAENEQVFDAAGNANANLRLAFSYRPIAPWDQDWHGSPLSPPQWDTVVTTSGGSTPFIARSDLSVLIPSYYNG